MDLSSMSKSSYWTPCIIETVDARELRQWWLLIRRSIYTTYLNFKRISRKTISHKISVWSPFKISTRSLYFSGLWVIYLKKIIFYFYTYMTLKKLNVYIKCLLKKTFVRFYLDIYNIYIYGSHVFFFNSGLLFMKIWRISMCVFWL